MLGLDRFGPWARVGAVFFRHIDDAVAGLIHRSNPCRLLRPRAWLGVPVVLGVASPEDAARVDALRAQWRESNVGSDPLSVIASSLRGIETAFSAGADIGLPVAPDAPGVQPF